MDARTRAWDNGAMGIDIRSREGIEVAVALVRDLRAMLLTFEVGMYSYEGGELELKCKVCGDDLLYDDMTEVMSLADLLDKAATHRHREPQ